MRKVSWPKRKELTKLYNCSSFNSRFYGGIFFALVDLGISSVIEWYLGYLEL